MHLRRISTGIVTIAAVAGCASAPPAVEAPGTSSNDRAAAMSAAGTPTRWQTMLQATQQRTAMAAPTAQQKTTGSVFLSEAGANRTRVRMTVSTDVRNASQMLWAIVPGRCGAGSMPIAGVQTFPVIEIGNNGRGELDMEIPITLPTTGTYHVNVYNGGIQLNNVVSCGNLTVGR